MCCQRFLPADHHHAWTGKGAELVSVPSTHRRSITLFPFLTSSAGRSAHLTHAHLHDHNHNRCVLCCL